MPSQISLREQQYYGNPQNAFWWIMSELLGFPYSLSYAQRTEIIRRSPFAIWDVLAQCERPGSLDSDIVRSTEVSNDLGSFLQCNKNISLIAYNGGAAKAIFRRHCKHFLNADFLARTPPKTVQLPSTSPAYASINKETKLARWRDAFNDFL